MGWQTVVAIQLQAGNTIINANGSFTYSGAPALGNLIGSDAPAGGADQFGNHYVQNYASYGSTFASSLNSGFVTFYTGSLAGGWTSRGSIQSGALGDIILLATTGRTVQTNNNTLDDGSGNMTIGGALTVTGTTSSLGGSTSVGPADNSGVTSGPSGTVSSFPAAGPNHTHAMAHHHPYHP